MMGTTMMRMKVTKAPPTDNPCEIRDNRSAASQSFSYVFLAQTVQTQQIIPIRHAQADFGGESTNDDLLDSPAFSILFYQSRTMFTCVIYS